MTLADDVIQTLRGQAAGMTDAELATLLSKRHQHVNQTCRRLADQGLLVREVSPGGIVNMVPDGIPVQAAQRTDRPAASMAEEWAWEGNVQSRVATHLATTGWSLIRVADTARREQGVDIVAERDGQRLMIEVKGWPSKTYARGERAGQPKPTQPTLQATHWFAGALTSLIRRGMASGRQLALALPDMRRYRTLLSEAAWALERLEIIVYLVTADGAVHEWEN